MPRPNSIPAPRLLVLTALNLLNYVDRYVLFAVQPLVQDEFHLSKLRSDISPAPSLAST